MEETNVSRQFKVTLRRRQSAPFAELDPSACFDDKAVLIGQGLQISFSAAVPTLESNYFSRKSAHYLVVLSPWHNRH
jgi:hypothetical protein